MVTGKSNMDVTGRRHLGRGGKKKGRRERHQQETQQSAEPEDDDSSDLSDDSDDDENNIHRLVTLVPDPVLYLSHTLQGRRCN